MGIKNIVRTKVNVIRAITAKLDVNEKVYKTMKPFSKKIISVNPFAARDMLEIYCPNTKANCINKSTIHQPFQFELQIIIPAYNAEDFLKECIESVLTQKTRYSFIVVIVNDGSTDGTSAIAESFKSNENVKVIHQTNTGISGARNVGLKDIYAKYIMFVDSDDKLMPGAIEALMSVAEAREADAVQGGFNDLYDGQLSIRVRFNNINEVNAEERFIGMAWAKVFRSELFQNLCFPQGYWFEDTICSFLIYPFVKKAFLIPEIVYTYRMNPSSITHVAIGEKKSIDTVWITELMMNEHTELGLQDDEVYYNKVMKQIILNYKRIKQLPQEIQQSAFSVTVELFCKNIDGIPNSGQYADLHTALKTHDFGLYHLYCNTH